jgi:hypothetical protein
MIMATWIIILIGLALIHFVYEGILLPSIRLGLRDRLFHLRDELRALKIRQPEKFDGAAFDIVHDGINNYLNRLPQLTISFQNQFRRFFDANESFREQLKARRQIVDASPNEELKQIVKRADAVLQEALIANSAAWFVYLIPIIVFAVTLHATTSQVKALLSVPAARAANFFPASRELRAA